ncbi:isochorismatase family cysteine hydrolase [Clostridium vincentii]|uniref:Isochorismatase family protein n=1 Tax=Clostridium vincentii TaxID=52704 RepID=A0A2T0BDA2_9CLOT|nr:isochorismatase family cysteine hydrolase [Clostridium vincentii]PRR81864.1 Isochorismatase family protein [Clostridium vincentii]
MNILMINKILDMQKEISGKILQLTDLQKEKTAIIVVDMVNGFVHKGQLASPRVIEIIDNLVIINEKTHGYKKIFFLDEHDENSMEFKYYAKHCLKDTSESELILELRGEATTLHKNTTMIHKNSTNGFHAPEFKLWLDQNQEKIENYIIVGCEVDICVSHFATTLKTYFNQNNLSKRIIVASDCVETFDFGTHDGDLMKVISLWEMQTNGIEIVDKII